MKIIKLFFIGLLIILNINFLYACSSDSIEETSLKKDLDFLDVNKTDKSQDVLSAFASVESGEYEEPFILNLYTNEDNSTIYYSFDKKNYDVDSFMKYETPIIIDKDTFIRFYGTYLGQKSNVIEKEYILKMNGNKNNISQNNKKIKEYIKDVKIAPPKKSIPLSNAN